MNTWIGARGNSASDSSGRRRVMLKVAQSMWEIGYLRDQSMVACPSPKSLKGWTKSCGPPVLGECGSWPDVGYFSVRDLAHFLSWYVEGYCPMTLTACRERCDKSCVCRVFFFFFFNFISTYETVNKLYVFS